MAADASFRSYDRLTGDDGTAVLMDAPPPEEVAPFLHIQKLLLGWGLGAPRLLAADREAGFLLLEDLGDRTELHLIHEHLAPAIQPGVQAGWHAHLDLLLDLLNGEPARDFWVHFNALEEAYEAERD